jgi:hypothetical protein
VLATILGSQTPKTREGEPRKENKTREGEPRKENKTREGEPQKDDKTREVFGGCKRARIIGLLCGVVCVCTQQSICVCVLCALRDVLLKWTLT